MTRNSLFYVSTAIHHSRSTFRKKRKEKLFVSVVIKDNGDVIIWSKGHDYDAKSEEEKSF